MVTRRLRITGTVQGVGFRYALQARAQQLGVTGWVRNRRDGSVEAQAQGAPEALDALAAWARRGPPGARVQEFTSEELADAQRYARFDIQSTA